MNEDKLSKSQTLVVRYAENRERLREIEKRIAKLNADFDYKLDLNKYRDSWYNGDHEEPLSVQPFWSGWVNAVTVDEHKKEERDLAELLDLKKEIIQQAGAIKRAICFEGKRLLQTKGTECMTTKQSLRT